MNAWRRAELFFGVACGLLGALPFFLRHGAGTFRLFRNSPALLVEAVLMLLLPGILVAIGAYFHALRRKRAGLVILLIGGIFLTLMMLIHFFSGAVFYLYGKGGGAVVLLQGLVALLTVITVMVGSVPTTQHRS